MAIGVTLTPNAAKRTAIAVRRVLGPKLPDLMPVESVERAGYDFLQYWVEITGGSATAGYTFKRIKHSADGTHADFDPAYTTGKAFELNSLGVAVGTVVRLTYMGRTTGETPSPFFVFSSPSPVIPVRLSADNGTGHTGGPTTAASFTYTITDLDSVAVLDSSGTALAGIAPTHNRPIGLTTAATRGTLGRKADGTWELYQTDECLGSIQRSC